jgi:hypothetical protein
MWCSSWAFLLGLRSYFVVNWVDWEAVSVNLEYCPRRRADITCSRFAVKAVEQAQVCTSSDLYVFSSLIGRIQTYWNLLEKVDPRGLRLTKYACHLQYSLSPIHRPQNRWWDIRTHNEDLPRILWKCVWEARKAWRRLDEECRGEAALASVHRIVRRWHLGKYTFLCWFPLFHLVGTRKRSRITILDRWFGRTRSTSMARRTRFLVSRLFPFS